MYSNSLRTVIVLTYLNKKRNTLPCFWRPERCSDCILCFVYFTPFSRLATNWFCVGSVPFATKNSEDSHSVPVHLFKTVDRRRLWIHHRGFVRSVLNIRQRIRKPEVDSIIEIQPQSGIKQFWKLYLNLCHIISHLREIIQKEIFAHSFIFWNQTRLTVIQWVISFRPPRKEIFFHGGIFFSGFMQTT